MFAAKCPMTDATDEQLPDDILVQNSHVTEKLVQICKVRTAHVAMLVAGLSQTARLRTFAFAMFPNVCLSCAVCEEAFVTVMTSIWLWVPMTVTDVHVLALANY